MLLKDKLGEYNKMSKQSPGLVKKTDEKKIGNGRSLNSGNEACKVLRYKQISRMDRTEQEDKRSISTV